MLPQFNGGSGGHGPAPAPARPPLGRSHSYAPVLNHTQPGGVGYAGSTAHSSRLTFGGQGDTGSRLGANPTVPLPQAASALNYRPPASEDRASNSSSGANQSSRVHVIQVAYSGREDMTQLLLQQVHANDPEVLNQLLVRSASESPDQLSKALNQQVNVGSGNDCFTLLEVATTQYVDAKRQLQFTQLLLEDEKNERQLYLDLIKAAEKLRLSEITRLQGSLKQLKSIRPRYELTAETETHDKRLEEINGKINLLRLSIERGRTEAAQLENAIKQTDDSYSSRIQEETRMVDRALKVCTFLVEFGAIRTTEVNDLLAGDRFARERITLVEAEKVFSGRIASKAEAKLQLSPRASSNHSLDAVKKATKAILTHEAGAATDHVTSEETIIPRWAMKVDGDSNDRAPAHEPLQLS